MDLTIIDLINFYFAGFAVMFMSVILFVIARFWFLLNRELKRG